MQPIFPLTMDTEIIPAATSLDTIHINVYGYAVDEVFQ